MKRVAILLLILAALAVIVAVLSRRREQSAAAGVASLVPADTALLVHVPDLEQSREAWHHTDLYALYSEPAVQEFLRKPAQRLAKQSTLDAWRGAAALRMRDSFIALKGSATLRLTGGFEFRCGAEEAKRLIEQSREAWLPNEAQRNTIDYSKHVIEVWTTPQLAVASTIAGNRFFFATSIDDLKALLDRLDRNANASRLANDAKFRAAMKQMPRDYAAVLYLQPHALAKQLEALRARTGHAFATQPTLEGVQCISHALVFAGGKMRAVDFAARPRVSDAKLTRDTLSLASADTLLYLAAIVNLKQQLVTAAKGARIFADAKLSAEQIAAALGDEMSLLMEWPVEAGTPKVLATLNVRDPGRARDNMNALAKAAGWQKSVRNGVEFFSATPPANLRFARPVLAMTEKLVAFGIDPATVEHFLGPNPPNALSGIAGFRDSSRPLLAPDQMFVWIDLGTLYTRLDATLRPLLQLSSAVFGKLTDEVDVSKAPPADVVAKHLSPVAGSLSYVDGGYRLESIGPITLDQALFLLVSGYGRFGSWRQQQPSPSPAANIPSPRPLATP